MPNVALIIVLGVLLIVLVLVTGFSFAFAKKGTMKALGLEDSLNADCTLQKVYNIGENTIFKDMPKRFSNNLVICAKGEEITMFIKNATKGIALKHLMKFNKDDIINTTYRKSLNMTVYTIELNTGDKFELYISQSRFTEFSKILKADKE